MILGMATVVALASIVLLIVWLRREYAHARPYRIATHAYYLHKKSRGKVQAKKA